MVVVVVVVELNNIIVVVVELNNIIVVVRVDEKRQIFTFTLMNN